MAYKDRAIMDAVTKKTVPTGVHDCPKCKIALHKLMYEGVEVEKCSFCQGVLLSGGDITKILIRQEVGFSERIIRVGEGIRKKDKKGEEFVICRDPQTLLQCPECRHPKARMMRMFYTEAYRVEIDKCLHCGLIWFDKDELEILQFLIWAKEGIHRKECFF